MTNTQVPNFYCRRCNRMANCKYVNSYTIVQKVVDSTSPLGFTLEKIMVCGGCIDTGEFPVGFVPPKVENGAIILVDFKNKKKIETFDVIEGYTYRRRT